MFDFTQIRFNTTLADIFTTTAAEPSAKRRKAHTSRLLSLVSDEDVYIRTVTARMGEGLVDGDEKIRATVRAAVAEFLSDDISLRCVRMHLQTICDVSEDIATARTYVKRHNIT